MYSNLENDAALFKLQRAAEEKARKKDLVITSRYKDFKATYRNDPVAFVHDAFMWADGKRPAPYQDEIIDNLAKYGREAVRGCHGLGKTALSSWLIHWFALTRDGDSDWKAPTTASNWRQLTKFLWPEIHKWARRLRWDVIGRRPYDERIELQTLNLKLSTGESFAVASNNPGFIEGAHADSLLYIFDESKLIPGETFDAAEGAFSGAGVGTGNEAFALSVSTPGESAGRFYDIHQHKPGFKDWRTRHVKLEEAIKAGRVSQEWVNNRLEQWGESSAIYQNRVLGEFADSDENSLIPLSWVEKANERWYEINGAPYEGAAVSYGIDVAREGDDKTCFVKLSGDVVEWIIYRTKNKTTETTDDFIELAGDDFESPVAVDANGVGAGVYDQLEQKGYNVTSYNVQAPTDLTDSTGTETFNNMRSAILWAVRELLDPENPEPLALPEDDLLTADLTAIHWGHTVTGKIAVEPKKDIKAVLGRSPDGSDALALAVYGNTYRIISWDG